MENSGSGLFLLGYRDEKSLAQVVTEIQGWGWSCLQKRAPMSMDDRIGGTLESGKDGEANLEAGTEPMVNTTRLHVWLSDSNWDVTQLVRFLRGDDMPASYARMEPYEWIDDALANGGSRSAFESELAKRLGRLLDEEPEIQQSWPRSEQVLFNLLAVCANLHQPARIAGTAEEDEGAGKIAGRMGRARSSWTLASGGRSQSSGLRWPRMAPPHGSLGFGFGWPEQVEEIDGDAGGHERAADA